MAVRAIAYCSKRKPNNLHCPIYLRKSNRRVEEDGKISLMKIICCQTDSAVFPSALTHTMNCSTQGLPICFMAHLILMVLL